MKLPSFLSRAVGWSPLLGLGLVLSVGQPGALAGDAPAPGANPEARKLEARAGELEQMGQGEEAGKLRAEAREVRARTGAPPAVANADHNANPDATAMRRERMQERLADLRVKLGARRAAGDEREVAELETQVGRLERALNQPAGRGQDIRSPRGNGMGRGPRGMDGPGRPNDHLRQAVEQLHAAGLHQLAERVAQEGTRQMGAEHGAAGPAIRGEIEQLRSAVRELRAAVEEMRRRNEFGPRRRL